MPWAWAKAWIITLNVAHRLGASDWRLPAVTDTGASGCDFSYLGTDCGYNVDVNTGEMARLYYSTLGNIAAFNSTGVPRRCASAAPNYCLANPGPFAHLQPAEYWSGTEYLPNSASAWEFNFSAGNQDAWPKSNTFYAWAVRDRDIDADAGGVAESEDNCTLVANPGQLDTDADGYGNFCDADLNNSGLTTATDFNLLRGCLNLPSATSAICAAADMNGSGLVTATDFNLLRAMLNTAPGPSGLPPCTPGAVGCGWGTGEMLTFDQNVWGDPTSVAAALLIAKFDTVYHSGLELGIPYPAGFSMTLSWSGPVIYFLPAVGVVGTLTANLLDPASSSAGSFGGDATALSLNVDFSDAGVLGGRAPALLGDLRVCNFALLPEINGQTVRQFLATANTILGGGSAAFGAEEAAAVSGLISDAFADGIPSTFAHDYLVNGACP